MENDVKLKYRLFKRAGVYYYEDTQFLAGLPTRKAAFPNPNETRWNPRALLKSEFSIDRYAAVKALGFVGNPSDANAILTIAVF